MSALNGWQSQVNIDERWCLVLILSFQGNGQRANSSDVIYSDRVPATTPREECMQLCRPGVTFTPTFVSWFEYLLANCKYCSPVSRRVNKRWELAHQRCPVHGKTYEGQKQDWPITVRLAGRPTNWIRRGPHPFPLQFGTRSRRQAKTLGELALCIKSWRFSASLSGEVLAIN